MAIDLPRRMIKRARNTGRKTLKSQNPEMGMLTTLYSFLSRRTDAGFNKVVAKRLLFSKRNKAPVSLARLSKLNKEGKTMVLVGTVTNDVRIETVPKMSVCALRFTTEARARIEKSGGECLTFDQLALRSPKGQGCLLIRGPTKSREAEKHFGRAPGLPGSHTKPYANPKFSH